MYYTILTGILGVILVGLYVAIVNIVIQSMEPQKKYQKTTTFDPAFPAWVGSIFVMIFISGVIAIQTLPTDNIPYTRWIHMVMVVLIFGTIGLIAGSARRDIHPDDPEVKLGPAMTVTNIVAACIPIIVSVLAASGIANVIGGTGILLFLVLAIPSTIGASLVMLFTRSASNPAYTYGTVATICSLLLGVLYILPSKALKRGISI